MSELAERFKETDIMRYVTSEEGNQYYFVHDGKRSRDFHSLGEARFEVSKIMDKLEAEG